MPIHGAEVNLTLAPSFPYLHLPMYHLKRAADGFTDICQDIPRGRHRTAAWTGNHRRILFRLFRPSLRGNRIRADERYSSVLKRNVWAVEVFCRPTHILNEILHRGRGIKVHFWHRDRLQTANRLRISPTPWTRPCPLKASVITFVTCLVEEAAFRIIHENRTT